MDLDKWLEQAGLDRLAPPLRAAGIDLDVLLDLDVTDLAEIGLNLGDRKRLLKAIEASSQTLGATSVAVADIDRTATEPAAAAERRQLSVMFCDLVGSTALSGRLDPEDLRQVVNSYHQAVSAAVAPFEGFVAQLLGDGVLVYFGYPRAHEDDADRCLRAGLAVLQAVARLQLPGDQPLQTRIGIASGQVVVGEIGMGTPAAEMSASGETPNLAARLQGCAQPGQIVISAETRRLVGKSFDLKALESLNLKGFEGPVLAWQVVGEHSVASRFEAQRTSDLTHFIGRESEASMLSERLAMATEGEGQVVLLSGEAGIGKSRICQVLTERVAQAHVGMVVWQCSPYSVGSSLHPVIVQLQRAAGWTSTDSAATRVTKFEQHLEVVGTHRQDVSPMRKLVGLEADDQPAAAVTPHQAKAATMNAIVDGLRRLADHGPTLLLVEDAHWIDPTTDELLGLVIDRLRTARLMVLVTARPEYVPAWGSPSHLTRIVLGRLGQRQSASLIRFVAGGRPLPDEVVSEIVKKTDGIPLFVEELTKTVLESGLMRTTATGFELIGPVPALAIPSTLQDSLMARLDRVAPAKTVAQVGASIGREFPHRLLSAVLAQMPERQLLDALADLVRSELVFRRGTGPDTVYSFKHALVRDTAYSSMVKSQRALRHAQIADALTRDQQEAIPVPPELLAFHYQEAGDAAQAFLYWRTAGDSALRRTALHEGIKHYRSAVSLLGQLRPEEDVVELECELQLKMAAALMNTEGYNSPDTKRCFARARDLTGGTADVDRYLAVCSGITPTSFSEGQFSNVIDLYKAISEDRLATATAANRISTHGCIGIAHFHLGRYGDAWQRLSEAIAIDEANTALRVPALGGAISAVPIRAYASRVRAYSGHMSQALQVIHDALDIADRSGHVPSKVWALAMLPFHYLLKGDSGSAGRYAQEALGIAERMGLAVRVGMCQINLGRIQVATGHAERGLDLMQQGYATWAKVGGIFHSSEYCAMIASCLLDGGLLEEAQQFVQKGEQAQAQCEERLAEAELIRLRGRLLEEAGHSPAASEQYRLALDLAERQGAKLFSLRAATDRARLVYRADGPAEALRVLSPVCDWFDHDTDYPDVRNAKAARDQMAQEAGHPGRV